MGQYQGNSVVSRQHELHASRAEWTTVQHEMNETHNYSVLLCGGSYPKQDHIFASLSYRGDAGRLLHETTPRISFRSSSQSHHGR